MRWSDLLTVLRDKTEEMGRKEDTATRHENGSCSKEDEFCESSRFVHDSHTRCSLHDDTG